MSLGGQFPFLGFNIATGPSSVDVVHYVLVSAIQSGLIFMTNPKTITMKFPLHRVVVVRYVEFARAAV